VHEEQDQTVWIDIGPSSLDQDDFRVVPVVQCCCDRKARTTMTWVILVSGSRKLTITIFIEQGEGLLEFSNLLFSKLISHGVYVLFTQ